MASRKTYRIVATAIGRALFKTCGQTKRVFFKHLMDELCRRFEEDNPRFDSSRFWDHVEIEQGEIHAWGEEWEKMKG